MLCPRADSEVVCEAAIEKLQGRPAPVVLDLCAGTGCLGLGVARARPDAQVTCVEKSPEAWPWLQGQHGRAPAWPPCRPIFSPGTARCGPKAWI